MAKSTVQRAYRATIIAILFCGFNIGLAEWFFSARIQHVFAGCFFILIVGGTRYFLTAFNEGKNTLKEIDRRKVLDKIRTGALSQKPETPSPKPEGPAQEQRVGIVQNQKIPSKKIGSEADAQTTMDRASLFIKAFVAVFVSTAVFDAGDVFEFYRHLSGSSWFIGVALLLSFSIHAFWVPWAFSAFYLLQIVFSQYGESPMMIICLIGVATQGILFFFGSRQIVTEKILRLRGSIPIIYVTGAVVVVTVIVLLGNYRTTRDFTSSNQASQWAKKFWKAQDVDQMDDTFIGRSLNAENFPLLKLLHIKRIKYRFNKIKEQSPEIILNYAYKFVGSQRAAEKIAQYAVPILVAFVVLICFSIAFYLTFIYPYLRRRKLHKKKHLAYLGFSYKISRRLDEKIADPAQAREAMQDFFNYWLDFLEDSGFVRPGHINLRDYIKAVFLSVEDVQPTIQQIEATYENLRDEKFEPSPEVFQKFTSQLQKMGQKAPVR